MKDVVMAGVGQEGTQYTAASLLSLSQASFPRSGRSHCVRVPWHPKMHERRLALSRDAQVGKSTVCENTSSLRPTWIHAGRWELEEGIGEE